MNLDVGVNEREKRGFTVSYCLKTVLSIFVVIKSLDFTGFLYFYISLITDFSFYRLDFLCLSTIRNSVGCNVFTNKVIIIFIFSVIIIIVNVILNLI